MTAFARYTRPLVRVVAAVALATLIHQPAEALEGGLGAYLLGGRDSMAGFVPPPGTYVTNSFYYLEGKAPTLSLGGVAVANPRITLSINKLDVSHFFGTTILGGTPGLIVSAPYAWGTISASGALGRFTGSVRDTKDGFADIAGTAVLGWHDGNLHYSAALTVFAPTAPYALATVNLGPPPSTDNLLNFSKNRFAFVPAVSATYLDPKVGLEVSGSLSVEASMRNQATDWQSAPLLNVETAVMQHLPFGAAIGVAAYASQQIGEDSGTGAENFKRTVDARSLQARVFGVGPMLTYRTKIGDTSLNFKLKYTHELGSRRRFESNIVSGSIGISF
jgi:hypothetical protein